MTRLKRRSCVEGCVENPLLSYISSTSSDRYAGIPRYLQTEEEPESPATLGESRALNILTLSTTTKFFI